MEYIEYDSTLDSQPRYSFAHVEGDTEKRGERVIVTREGAQGETDRQRRPGGETAKKRPRGEAHREKQGRKRCKAEERA